MDRKRTSLLWWLLPLPLILIVVLSALKLEAGLIVVFWILDLLFSGIFPALAISLALVVAVRSLRRGALDRKALLVAAPIFLVAYAVDLYPSFAAERNQALSQAMIGRVEAGGSSLADVRRIFGPDGVLIDGLLFYAFSAGYVDKTACVVGFQFDEHSTVRIKGRQCSHEVVEGRWFVSSGSAYHRLEMTVPIGARSKDAATIFRYLKAQHQLLTQPRFDYLQVGTDPGKVELQLDAARRWTRVGDRFERAEVDYEGGFD